MATPAHQEGLFQRHQFALEIAPMYLVPVGIVVDALGIKIIDEKEFLELLT